MIRTIKKVLANRQVKQARQRRIKNNKLQIKLILQGLNERAI